LFRAYALIVRQRDVDRIRICKTVSVKRMGI